jgi:hypothetical protein
VKNELHSSEGKPAVKLEKNEGERLFLFLFSTTGNNHSVKEI